MEKLAFGIVVEYLITEVFKGASTFRESIAIDTEYTGTYHVHTITVWKLIKYKCLILINLPNNEYTGFTNQNVTINLRVLELKTESHHKI